MNKTWIKAALVRAVKTMAQTAVAMIMAQTAAAMIGTTVVLQDVDWLVVGSASVLAGILSLLTSLGGLPEVNCVKPSDEELSNGEE